MNTQSTTRKERIAQITARRKPLAAQVAATQQTLNRLSVACMQLEKQRLAALNELTSDTARERMKNLNIVDVSQAIKECDEVFRRLRVRFDRDTINIGVIGLAGQGKSRLLQTTSGLPSFMIPDGKSGDCTGARSTLRNDDCLLPLSETYVQSENAPYARVTFLSRERLLNDVLRAYHRALSFSPPDSLEEFARDPLPSMPKEENTSALNIGLYEHLSRYHADFRTYEPLLSKEPKQIRPDQVREYVAQYTGENNEKMRKYLAVDNVEVHCRFPYEDVGQIALIDMPGMGDTGLGDAERMLHILSQDVDIVLMVRRPDPRLWREWDSRLYDMASRALADIPFAEWCFLVLNHTASDGELGDNGRFCTATSQKLAEMKIGFASILTADCSDPQEVRTMILDPVLNHLQARIVELDSLYLSRCQERLRALETQTRAMLSDARRALGTEIATDSAVAARFEPLFEAVWEDLTNGMKDLLRGLEYETRETENFSGRFKAAVEEAFVRTYDDTGIPPVEEIERLAGRLNSYDSAYNELLHGVRTRLNSRFHALEEELHCSLETVRRGVANVLKTQGRLQNLARGEGTEYLSLLSASFLPEPEGIRAALLALSSFELTYRGFLQFRLRPHLYRLHPNTTPYRPEPGSANVQEALETMLKGTRSELREEFMRWAEEPKQVAYAIVDEFIDRALWTKPARMEWRQFYLENRMAVWERDFRGVASDSKLHQQWGIQLDQIANILSDGLQITMPSA